MLREPRRVEKPPSSIQTSLLRRRTRASPAGGPGVALALQGCGRGTRFDSQGRDRAGRRVNAMVRRCLSSHRCISLHARIHLEARGRGALLDEMDLFEPPVVPRDTPICQCQFGVATGIEKPPTVREPRRVEKPPSSIQTSLLRRLND